jgi:uncharacterized protein (DUF433 family)
VTDADLLARISCDPAVLAGKPVIGGTRLSVDYVLNLLAHGASVEEIVDEYSGLTADDIRACLLFAQRAIESTSFFPTPTPA